MHQTQWSPERPLPPPVSLTSQSHHEKPPEVTCTSREKPGFPASTRERTHIGLRNVRDRIEQMCGGTMLIRSEIGKGAAVTLLIPDQARSGQKE